MKTQEQKAFQRDLIISLVLHLIFVVIFIYGIPSIFEKLPEENQVITFEMLTVSDIVNVRNQDIKKPEPKEIKESKKTTSSPSPPEAFHKQKCYLWLPHKQNCDLGPPTNRIAT